MAGTTSVPQIQFTPTGLVVPSDADVLAGVQADLNAAFGGNLNPALNTPQGQIASSEAAIITNTNNVIAEFVNQVNPDTASGFMQDAIARIYFLTRNPGTPTAVQCVCIGLLGTVIPVGAQAVDTSGNVYLCTEAGTIPSGGSITLPFACQTLGPNACPANTLNRIYQAITGWDSVNNPADGVEGSNVESRAAFEFRRQQSVAKNAAGSLPAIYAAVFDVPDVIDVYVTQNNTTGTVNTGTTNYPLVANSVYVAAVGGDALAVATAIWENTNIGANYNGNTTESVSDPSGYSAPVPTYAVKFEIPTGTPVYFDVQLTNSASLPSNIVALVQAAIIAAFVGSDGSTRARIGSQILASKFYAAVSAIGSSVSIISILVGLTSPGASNSVTMGIDQAPTIVAGNITVSLV